MPKIPVYSRQQSLSTQAPAVETNAASYGQVAAAKAQLGNTIAQAGAQIANTADSLYAKFEQAKNYQEELEGDLSLINKVNAISEKASLDPDVEKNLQTYQNELTKGLDESAKSITNPELRNQFMLKGQMKLETANAALRDLGRKSIITKGQANTQALVDQYINIYAATGDETYLKDIESAFNIAKDKGFYDEKQIYERKKKALDDSKDMAFSYDLQNNPKVAGEKLDSNKYGFDIEKLGKAKAQYDRELKKTINMNEEAVLDTYLQGGLKEEDVKQLREDGKIDARFAVGMISKLKNGNSNKTNPIKYMEAVDVIVSPTMTGKAKREYLLDLLNTQQISDSDFQSLYKNGISGGASVATQYMAEKMTEEERLQSEAKKPIDMNWLKSGVDIIKGSSILGDLDVAATTMRLFSAISGENLTGKGITSKAKELVKDVLVARYPSIGLMKDIPNKIYDGSEVKTVYAGDNELIPTKKFEPDTQDKAIGDVITVGNTDYRIVGTDADGEPLVEAE